MPQHFSQIGQDYLLDRAVFRGMRNGTFVEAGALDGVRHSNTLFFERTYDWSGLCIEANPFWLPALRRNRKSVCLNVGIGDREGTFEFQALKDSSEGLSGFVGAAGREVQQRIQKSGAATEIIRVPMRRLPDILADHDIREIHYLSLDTQGEEPDILRSLRDFRPSPFIHVIDVECHNRHEKAALIEAAGPAFVAVIRHRFDLFLINRASPFVSRRWSLVAASIKWNARKHAASFIRKALRLPRNSRD